MKRSRVNQFLVLISIFAMSLCCLWGCGSQFDPVVYTQAVMDNIFADQSEALVEMDACTEDEAEAIHQEWIDSLESGIVGDAQLSDETHEALKEALNTLYSKANYQVGQASKNDDGSYSVTLTYSTCQVFGPANGAWKKALDEFIASEEYDEIDQDQLMDAYFQLYTECLEAQLDQVSYGDSTETTLTIQETDQGWEISSDSFHSLCKELFDFDSLKNVLTQE